jgi:hypothetical protein
VGCEVFLRERFERKEMRFGIEGGWRRRSRSRCVGVVWFVVSELWVAVRVLCGFAVQAYRRVGSCERKTRVYFGSKQVCFLGALSGLGGFGVVWNSAKWWRNERAWAPMIWRLGNAFLVFLYREVTVVVMNTE